MKALISGFGINDATYPVSSTKNKSGSYCPYFSRWVTMIYRCYGNPKGYKAPGYDDCYVCDEWKSFMNFRGWMITQEWEGKQLDKDLVSYGNRVYSKEFCTFIQAEVNRAIIKLKMGDQVKKGHKLMGIAARQSEPVKSLLTKIASDMILNN